MTKLCLQSCLSGQLLFILIVEVMLPSIDNVQYVFEWSICPAAALKPLERHKALLHAVCLAANQIISLKNHRPHAEIFWKFSRRMDAALLTQGKDDDKEKWQNSRREACYTLLIEGIFHADKLQCQQHFILADTIGNSKSR